jgi:hypothetical protein
MEGQKNREITKYLVATISGAKNVYRLYFNSYNTPQHPLL